MFTLLFGDYEFPNQTFEIDGLPSEGNIQEANVPRRHGSIIQAPYLKSRTLRIRGTIHNDSAFDSHTQLLAMQAALLAGEENFQYCSDRYIKCYAKSLKPVFSEGTDKQVIDLDIQLVAQNPFFYSAGASYSDRETVSGITYNFNIFSGGNVFAEPKISFYADGATIANNILLKNITTGQQMRWRGTLNAGQTLAVDSEELLVNYGTYDGISQFEGDFITLDAGTNSFQFIGADCQITIEHKWRWHA